MDKLADNLKWAPSGVVSGADNILKAYKDKDPWDVFAIIVDMWQRTNPKEYDSFIFNLDTKKQTSKITTVGSKHFRGVSKDKGNSEIQGTGGYLRHRVDVPVKVVYMIRRLYPDISMDAKFFDKWARKFPDMRIEEVV